MEPLWSPVVATGGRRSQIEQARGPPKQAKTVAVGCDQLPFGAHGKEGVDGSSPSEGSAKAPQTRLLFSDRLADSGTWPGMEPFIPERMKSPVELMQPAQRSLVGS